MCWGSDDSRSASRQDSQRSQSAPFFFDVDWVEKMKDDIQLRPDDTWVVSYPKSGSTWTTQIVRLILNRGKDDGKNVMAAVTWIEAMHKGPPFNWYVDVNELPSPRAFKSHFSYELMPCALWPALQYTRQVHLCCSQSKGRGCLILSSRSWFLVYAHCRVVPTL